MNIGLGVTTYKRPEHLKLFKEQLKKFSKRGSTLGLGLLDYLVKIHEYDDEVARKGIAYGKNQCLKALKDCDYIFLFDDDCVPIKEGWIKWFIKAHKESGQHHFLYLRDTPSLRCTGVKKGIQIFNNCGGAFMFLTKEVLKTVGGFNKNYKLYGYEHAGYSDRIHKAGLTPFGAYLCPLGADKYIYAMDWDHSRKDEFQNKVKHAPSMKDEISRVPYYTEENRKVYEKDTKIYQEL